MSHPYDTCAHRGRCASLPDSQCYCLLTGKPASGVPSIPREQAIREHYLGRAATPPSVEPHPGSASSEAAGDARELFCNLAQMLNTVEIDWKAAGHWSEWDQKVIEGFCAYRAKLSTTPATQASKDRALSISGAAGPLGDPEILGSPTDPQMLDWLEANGCEQFERSAFRQPQFCWLVSESETHEYRPTLREAIRAAMSHSRENQA